VVDATVVARVGRANRSPQAPAPVRRGSLDLGRNRGPQVSRPAAGGDLRSTPVRRQETRAQQGPQRTPRSRY